MDDVNNKLHEKAQTIAEACYRFNLAPGLHAKRAIEEAIKEYSRTVTELMKARPRTRQEKEVVAIAAAQNIIIFPIIKKTLNAEQIKMLFPNRKGE